MLWWLKCHHYKRCICTIYFLFVSSVLIVGNIELAMLLLSSINSDNLAKQTCTRRKSKKRNTSHPLSFHLKVQDTRTIETKMLQNCCSFENSLERDESVGISDYWKSDNGRTKHCWSRVK